jgi:ankyrin repeat protein
MLSNLRRQLLLFLNIIILQFSFATAALAQGMPVVVQAAKDADWQTLHTLLDDGLQANAIYGDGTSALHWVSYHESEESAAKLLAAGANPNAVTDLGVTPLWLAAENGDAAMTKLLLGAGADPNIVLESGETIVMTASQTGNGSVVRQLLEAGADPNPAVTRDQTALMWAANNGHADSVAALLEFGADVAARSLVRSQYVKSEKIQDSNPAYKFWIEQGGNTPLIFAARSGDLRTTQLLVEGGAGINDVSAFGTSPAIMAVHGGNAETLNFLLEHGADPDLATSGHTALHVAVLRGNLDAIEVLLAHRANTEALLEKPTPVRRQSTDYNFHDSLIGATPLWLAARFSEPKIMQALLEAGANSNVVNDVHFPAERRGDNFTQVEGGVSLLMAAVGMGHSRLRVSWGTPERRAGQTGQSRESLILDTVKVAVATGVNLDTENVDGLSALDFAKSRRYESVVSYLRAAGAAES